ncbi:sigma-54-dependent transcriptional regulator [Desulfopila inferna]|uniref:sigma-54-dependent transcriptional regulator n=1 Tax=Desulfopila inferna TaxID=468528 RepID=UPI001964A965|nr:sigma-54 dependent transcriptional regulator [Desulfopila inferna]MBM9603119.1 sigma-54-dependent Fis family transcriptional regulator [Desulfopila inferna]
MAQILVIEDDPKINRVLERIVSDLGHKVSVAFTLAQGLKAAMEADFDIVLLDLTLPDGHGLRILPQLRETASLPEVIIVTGTGSQSGAELAFKSGAWDFVPKPFLQEDVALPLTRALQYRDEKKNVTPPRVLSRGNIVGDSMPVSACLKVVAQASISDAGVLITGETGTGKELFARAIHANSSRAEQPFVVVDCAAHSEQLIESTLFGHEKGAFTGAEQSRTGLISQANLGTLFLDEVGELTPAMQKAFLRVLQEHSFRPIGASGERVSDFRLLAATNRNLEDMVEKGHFRLDLLHRLCSLTLDLPPLRQHLEDIDSLVAHHLRLAGTDSGSMIKGFTPEFIKSLKQYSWPGNIRELFNTLDYALAHSGSNPTLYPFDLPPQVRMSKIEERLDSQDKQESAVSFKIAHGQKLPPLQEVREGAIAELEEKYLLELMRRTRGRIREACAMAGLSESRLHALLKKYNTPRFR